MVRLVIDKVEQRKFLLAVCNKLEFNTQQVGGLVGISGRSFRDWIHGELLPRKDAIEKLSELSGISVPPIIEEREEWWSGRVNGRAGAMASLRKHGVNLTMEDRKRGGHMSQVRRSENPEYYRALGCNIPNDFTIPELSCDLAEFVGVVLGDGGLTDGQCEITLHVVDDIEYAKHVKLLADRLFGSHASICSYPRHRVIKVVISGVKFTEILEGVGLKRGNKVKHQVDIPAWIQQNPEYLRACTRGLFDTDGGTFTHDHVVRGKRYLNFGLTFTSASRPLLKSYIAGLLQNGFDIHGTGMNIFIYGVKTAERFIEIFKPNNPKTKQRLENYLAQVTRVK